MREEGERALALARVTTAEDASRHQEHRSGCVDGMLYILCGLWKHLMPIALTYLYTSLHIPFLGDTKIHLKRMCVCFCVYLE